VPKENQDNPQQKRSITGKERRNPEKKNLRQNKGMSRKMRRGKKKAMSCRFEE
jgi:hypothetical protein